MEVADVAIVVADYVAVCFAFSAEAHAGSAEAGLVVVAVFVASKTCQCALRRRILCKSEHL